MGHTSLLMDDPAGSLLVSLFPGVPHTQGLCPLELCGQISAQEVQILELGDLGWPLTMCLS